MGFLETTFPDRISYGSRGGPGYKTELIEVDSGSENTVSRWSTARRRYNAAYGVKTADLLSELITFYHVVRGAANGFRFKDWTDYTTAENHRDAPSNTDVVIATGDGVTTVFQLKKFYVGGGPSDAVVRTRNLTKIVPDTTLVAIDGSAQSAAVWSVNSTSGLLTFNTAPGFGSAISAGCEFVVPVRFAIELDDLMDISIDDFQVGAAEVPMIEITDGLTVDEEFFYGGSTTFNPMTANQTITHLNGRFLLFNPNAAGRKVFLPDTASLPNGGPHFYIKNLSATHSLRAYAFDTISHVATLGAGVTIELLLHNNVWTAV